MFSGQISSLGRTDLYCCQLISRRRCGRINKELHVYDSIGRTRGQPLVISVRNPEIPTFRDLAQPITFRAWLGSGWVIAHFAWLSESCRLVYHSPGSELGVKSSEVREIRKSRISGSHNFPSLARIRLGEADIECGVSDHAFDPPGHRIINGTLVKKGELPWMAFVRSEEAGNCTASIISSKYLLLAGHCYEPNQVYHIKVGTVDIDNDESAVVMESKTAYLHPEYARHPTRNDIAIIELPEELQFNENIRPLCLKKTFDESNYTELALISGYGAKSFYPCPPCHRPPGAFDGKLRRGSSLFVSSEECKKDYGNLVSEAMICARGQNDTEIYRGDSGGPISIKNSSRSDGKVQWMQVGIVSWGHAGLFQESPMIFTRLSSYCSWIAEVTKNTVESKKYLKKLQSHQIMVATKIQCIAIILVYLILFITEIYPKPDPTAEDGCEIQRRCVPNGPEKHDCFWDEDARECRNRGTSKAEPGCKMRQRCVSKEPEKYGCWWYSNVLGDTCYRERM
ncbi:trypsin domain-containing protein [Ditylenchus destructor]|uniref:Trypsin domain-containing protein n=1 Tax=Ditylenchus destructor TaxID=166010 RepID=A0AAD4QXF1_9BILA|nr:trypsin domain-containing protein [Ditylenchus destructor]